MASEDSDQLVSGFAAVHGSDDFHDRREALIAEMLVVLHAFDAGRELLEVLALGGSQWILPKERDHHVEEILSPAHHVSVERLAMVIAAAVDHHRADTEEVPQLVQTPDATRALGDDEFMKHLIAGSVAHSAIAVRLSHQAEGEASFSVHKANHPADSDQPFLLIVRTRHIVTVPSASAPGTSSAGYNRMFQHTAGFL